MNPFPYVDRPGGESDGYAVLQNRPADRYRTPGDLVGEGDLLRGDDGLSCWKVEFGAGRDLIESNNYFVGGIKNQRHGLRHAPSIRAPFQKQQF